jgi:hypothetical protein
MLVSRCGRRSLACTNHAISIGPAFWVGRIDVPFLSEDVSLLGYAFDYVPINFAKELLVHEAHRHPFIERLGAMYLMRVRHGNFGSDAGGCWRQLFVVSLMPWLLRRRVFHEQRAMDSMRDRLDEEKVQMEEEEDPALKAATKVVMGTGADIVGGAAGVVVKTGVGVVEIGANAADVALEKTGDVVDKTAPSWGDKFHKDGGDGGTSKVQTLDAGYAQCDDESRMVNCFMSKTDSLLIATAEQNDPPEDDEIDIATQK